MPEENPVITKPHIILNKTDGNNENPVCFIVFDEMPDGGILNHIIGDLKESHRSEFVDLSEQEKKENPALQAKINVLVSEDQSLAGAGIYHWIAKLSSINSVPVTLIVQDTEQEKKAELLPKPLIIENFRPEYAPVEYFSEKKNYLNGRKLPKLKRKKR